MGPRAAGVAPKVHRLLDLAGAVGEVDGGGAGPEGHKVEGVAVEARAGGAAMGATLELGRTKLGEGKNVWRRDALKR